MKKEKIQRDYGMYTVIPPRHISICFETGKRYYTYKLHNIQTDFIYYPVSSSKVLKVNHFYYGYVREYGVTWAFVKKSIPNA